ncbi:MAG: murein biosynthesis integral membrane protein MurJ, partial [Chloroflexi bacterium]|nr:murein biosynthesis integral membrane protein MurJ [Chloroflexota bacterium]
AITMAALPAAIALIALGRPLIALLYQRGAFDPAATEAVYGALRWYALGLLGHASLEVAARAFFAQQDTLTPLYLAAGSAALNIVLGVLLMGPLGHGGLALANSLAVSVEVIALLAILRRRWGGIGAPDVHRTLGRVALSSTVMLAAIVAVLRLIPTTWGAFGALAAGASVGALSYVLSGLLLGLGITLRSLARWGEPVTPVESAL